MHQMCAVNLEMCCVFVKGTVNVKINYLITVFLAHWLLKWNTHIYAYEVLLQYAPVCDVSKPLECIGIYLHADKENQIFYGKISQIKFVLGGFWFCVGVCVFVYLFIFCVCLFVFFLLMKLWVFSFTGNFWESKAFSCHPIWFWGCWGHQEEKSSK